MRLILVTWIVCWVALGLVANCAQKDIAKQRDVIQKAKTNYSDR